METMDDIQLLRQYATDRSEAAFETLLRRHINLVYSSALRQVGDRETAAEVTQTVFIILARKAHTLRAGTIITGWLYRTTHFAAVRAIRTESRRRQRELEAAQMEPDNDQSIWEQLAPLLDEAMSCLGNTDRDAIVMRFFEHRSLKEVGAAFGANEDTAQKRVSRALVRLRTFFSKRGITLSVVAIGSVLSANAVHAAPATLTSKTLAVAAGHGVAASATLVALLQGTLKAMAWAKAKTAMIASTAILLAAGTTTVVIQANMHEAENNGPTVASFLARPPIIKQLVYEDTLYMNGQPTRQDFTVKLDGGRVLKSGPQAASGIFGTLFWRYQNMNGSETLGLHDSLDNPGPEGVTTNLGTMTITVGGFGSTNALLTEGLGEILGLGFPEIDRSREITWDKERNRLTGWASTFGRRLDYKGRFELELKQDAKGVTTSAVLHSVDATTGTIARGGVTVTYKYRDDFFDGRFPVEILREGSQPIWIIELEISDEHLPDDEMDPRKIYASYYTGHPKFGVILWTNGLPYEKIRGTMRQLGNSGPVVERAQLEHMVQQHRTVQRRHHRIILAIIVVLGACLVAYFKLRRKRIKPAVAGLSRSRGR
jgi:RNA polymerase sigma factor (sigma-70 family)